ncbi:MAG: protein kinase [Planctomycetales bacterium]|nr:protein kinase [Planctomycetales bacterium]
MSDKPTDSQWRLAEQVLLRFEDSWRESGEASISEYLPVGNSTERSYLLAELIKIDIEHRWARGEHATLEDYAREFPELGDVESISIDLVVAEFNVRVECGEAPTLEELRRRFPTRIDEMASLLAAEKTRVAQATRTTGAVSVVARDGRLPARIGRYEPLMELGRGAFAVVYRAWDHRLHRDVALKVLHTELIAIDELRERMLREARAAASLQHPAIVPIYEVHEEESLFIVSEFVDGETLGQRIDRATPSFDEVAGWAAQMAHGLHFAHQHGVIHRDIKPANIMLHRDGKLAITDFGLARQADAGESLTRHGDIVGTPAFMSPEQARGHSHAVDGRSDVYSVGVVIYRMLCGQLPFQGPAGSILTRIQEEEVALPRRVRRDIPRDLETICVRCLQKDPADRYASAGELAEDLERYLAGQPIKARPVGALERAWKWSKRRPALALTVWLLMLAMGFLAGIGMQLARVQTERDRAVVAESRAKSAEAEKTKSLAESYERAGSLAMQRGQFREAIGLFEQSLAAGSEHPATLRLKQVESHFVLREFSTCESILRMLEPPAATARLAKSQQGQFLMWQAELALRSDAVASNAAALYRQALECELSKADAAYIQGMTAEGSLEALQRFRESLVANPFHHRARTISVNLLASLGRLDEAKFQAEVGQQLFPEDPHFYLLEGLVLAVRGQREQANAIVKDQSLSEADEQAWQVAYRLADNLAALAANTPALSPAVGSRIVAEMLAERNSLVAVAEYGLRFPLPLTKRLSQLSELMGSGISQASHRAKPIVSELAALHPEGMLLVWLGEFQIADNELQAARDSFLRAVELPSLLRNHQRAARAGVIATASALGLARQIDVEENRRYAAEAIRELNANQEYPAGYCRLFTQVFLSCGDANHCRVWLDKWAGLAGADDYNVLWHRIELEAMSERVLHMLAACDRVLKEHPDDEHALRMRDGALQSIREATDGSRQPPSTPTE